MRSVVVLLAVLLGAAPVFAQTEEAHVEPPALTPVVVDLLWESDGLTPPFYQGRSLAGPGSKVRLLAMPTFGKGASAIAPQNLVYTWKKDKTVLGSLSGKGRSSITVESPLRYGAEVVSVDVSTEDGSASASASARIESIEPFIALYIDHPLFGPLFHVGLAEDANILESEASLMAVPFFAPARYPDSPGLVYEWRVNRNIVALSRTTPSRITISAAGSDGVALVELLVTHATNFFFEAERTWNLSFFSGSRGGGSGSDPFNAPSGGFSE
jgi:hypothetical protein